MAQPRQFHMGGGGGGNYYNNDTTFTKIFVGGLAWETQREAMRRYFEQFGEILEAVVITDKNTGRSKGYGFVTFKDPEAAVRACQNPSPVIDGRRANCNLASLGAQKTRPPTPHQQHGAGRIRPAAPAGMVAPPAPVAAYHGGSSVSSYIHHPTTQYPFPYSPYGYTGYSQDTVYPLNYYGVYGGQQLSPYYATTGASGAAQPGMFQNFYPFYTHYAQGGGSQAHGFGLQYPQIVQYPYLPQQYGSTSPAGIVSSTIAMPTSTAGPASMTMATTTTTATTTSTGVAVPGAGAGALQSPAVPSEQKSSA